MVSWSLEGFALALFCCADHWKFGLCCWAVSVNGCSVDCFVFESNFCPEPFDVRIVCVRSLAAGSSLWCSTGHLNSRPLDVRVDDLVLGGLERLALNLIIF